MLAAVVLGFASFAAADEKFGGWPELFPELGNFSRKIHAPTPTKGDNPKRYSQDATYEWTGGRFEVLTIKLWRDPAHKQNYAADAVKKLKPAPTELEINRKRAYLWDRMKPDQLDKVNAWLVVVLDDDKVLVIEQRGAGLELPDVAKKLDFARVIKALENPPPK